MGVNTEAEAGSEATVELAPDVAVPPSPPEPLVVPRNIQVVLLLVGVLGAWAAIRAARNVVLLFVIAGLIALILNPLVGLPAPAARPPRHRNPPGVPLVLRGDRRHRLPPLVADLRPGRLVSPLDPRTRPTRPTGASRRPSGSSTSKGIHVQLVKQGGTALQTLQHQLVKGSSSLVAFSGALLTKAASVSLDLVLILVLSVYMLVYGGEIGRLVRRVMPGDGSPADDYPLRVQRAVSGYVRGQLLFSLVMGTTAGLALYLFGVIGIFPEGRTYAFAFGAFFGVMELVPFIGPLAGAIPPIVVALFASPLTALWVGLLFLGIQQLEGHVVAPQIFSHALRINPLLVIFALLFGDAVYGLVGALIALPLAAVMRETIIYLRRHVMLEGWNAPGSRSPG